MFNIAGSGERFPGRKLTSGNKNRHGNQKVRLEFPPFFCELIT